MPRILLTLALLGCSSHVPAPVAARYAWVDNASEATIVGGDGLPLPPLRTDDWPLESAGRRYGR